MPGTGDAAYILGPLAVAATLAVVFILLRWTFGHERWLADVPQPAPGDFGLLETVAEPGDDVELTAVRKALSGAGIRCTIARTPDGNRVLVWTNDLVRARDLVRRVRGSLP